MMFNRLSNLFGDVAAIAHDAAITQGYISEITPHHLSTLSMEALQRSHDARLPNGQVRDDLTTHGFNVILDKISTHYTPEQRQWLSRLTALDTIVANAVSNTEYVDSLPSPKDQIKTFLTQHLAHQGDKKQAVAAVEEKLGTLIFSLTHTMHPTIYHTPEARTFEARLKRILENPANIVKAGGTLRLNPEGKKEIASLFNEEVNPRDRTSGFLKRLASSKANIAPKRPTTVSMETQAEKENLVQIRKQLADIIDAWNAVAAEGVTVGNEIVNLESLHITPERAREMIEFRTWGQSADADGREKSTFQFLDSCIQSNLIDVGPKSKIPYTPADQGSEKDKLYHGFSLDMRQNAKKVHVPFMDSLVQVNYRYSSKGLFGVNHDFQKFCKEFLVAHPEYGIKDPAQFRFSMMKGLTESKNDSNAFTDDRADFISEIIREDFRLIPQQIKTDVEDFTKVIGPIRKKFLEKHKDAIRAAGYAPETIDYLDMGNVQVKHPKARQMVSLRAMWDSEMNMHGWQLSERGLECNRLPDSDLPTPQQMQVRNFLQGTQKLNSAGEELYEELYKKQDDKEKNGSEKKPVGEKFDIYNHYSEITSKDRATFVDTAKRLFVIKDAIDKYGPKVATRYQIANFSEPSDFLILLKLFQDTGITTIKNGEVKSSKLAIMPLLETGEDLKAAPAIFSSLLRNPLATSFWKARGNEVEIMLGFSDGAASYGNFASQWQIYKAAQELTQLFEAQGFKVRFFQGRGRGVNRGGTIDPSLQMDMMPPEYTQHGIHDVTIQSDLPTDLAASKAYGEDYFTRAFLGTINASVNAPKHLTREEKRRLEPIEKGIQEIADRTAELYQQHVRRNKDALAVLNNISDIEAKTSRNSSRDGVKVYKKFDDVRAISKEYIYNGIDLPAHNVGLRQAIEEFEQKHGKQTLEKLYTHPFFKAVTKTIAAGMSDFDPTVAHAHVAHIANKQDKPAAKSFVEKCNEQLGGLVDKLSGFLKLDSPKSSVQERHKQFHPSSPHSLLDQVAHAIMISGIKDGQPFKPAVDRTDPWVDTLYNARFVTAQPVAHVQFPWKVRDLEVGQASLA